ncbi:MAG: hypothetical protein R3246_06610, partial [Acidimicrobiia bacterium]|nr:hypothetical protein [Acidimicrobiia bacterium]
SSTTAATSAPDTSAVPATSTTTVDGETQSTRPPPDPNRPLAPDFSLTLSDGTVYEHSSEVRPVFMVFWAEW